MEEPVRIRVEFEDHRHLLTKSQRKDGLRRCWVLLGPNLSTVADLAAHLASSFDLQHSCPRGILLYMDEFVLPLFESTNIFRDNDIIRVRKKACKQRQLLETCDNAYCIQDSENVAKQHMHFSDKLLASQDLPEDSRANERKKIEDACDFQQITSNTHALLSEETNLKRKRQHSYKPQSSNWYISAEPLFEMDGQLAGISSFYVSMARRQYNKFFYANGSIYMPLGSTIDQIDIADRRKKIKLNNIEKPIITAKPDENVRSEQNENFVPKRSSSRRMLQRKDGTSDGNGRCGSPFSNQNVDNVKNATNSFATGNRPDQVHANYHTSQPAPHVNGKEQKPPSRNACCKKEKRQWLWELANQQGISSKPQPVDRIALAEDEDVPMIIRPDHICFEPIDEEVHKSLSKKPVVSLQCNGMSSKKGQNWGKEMTFSGRYEGNGCKKVSYGKLINKKAKNLVDGINFANLFPLTRLPKEGDVVVYRLVEPSASWCRDLSPFRVGKVLSYNSLSMKIVLVLVPEYPIFLYAKRVAECSTHHPDASLDKDDGSLEIEYPSLVDVRLLKANESEATAANGMQGYKSREAAPANNWEVALSKANAKDSATHVTDPTPDSCRGQFDQDLSEKGAQLQGNGWDCWIANKSTAASWSWAVRSAVGPAAGFFPGKCVKYAKYRKFPNSKW